VQPHGAPAEMPAKHRVAVACGLLDLFMVLNIHRTGRLVAVMLALSGVATAAAAQVVPLRPDLARATIEDLMNIEITSASRKEQRADDTPAAVYVITQDDIRRSGIRTVPELFRLAPGVQVAQVTSSNWAVSIRGFNDQYTNKLLVLIDGRSIYQRTFSGVFWDAADLVLDDIDRIEVVRGPGGAVWGANAVNGVINIVTKAANETQGALVRVGGGTFDGTGVTARYGGSFGSAKYRVYSQWSGRRDTTLANLAPANDAWNAVTNGLRIDWARGADEWTLDGNFKTGNGQTTWTLPGSALPDVAPRNDVASSFRTSSVLGRWTHRGDNGSSLQVQSSVADVSRDDFVDSDEVGVDADVQYHLKAGTRQDIVAGGGYRFVNSRTGRNFAVSFDPAAVNLVVANLFVQDEVALTARVHLALGSKVEHDTFSGWGLQPTARLMWTPAQRHHVWIAASRALRTPTLSDRVLRVNVVVVPDPRLPIVVGILGNSAYRAEAFQDAEAGYRIELGSTLSVDMTTFRGHYAGLPTREPMAPVFETTPGPPHLFAASRLENRLQADTAGLEIAARLAPAPAWQLDASYSSFHLTPHADATSQDPMAAAYDGNAPAHQWRLGSSVWLGGRTEVNATLFHVGTLAALAVPAYTRADARVEVRLTTHLSAIAAGRNLLDPAHVEYTAFTIAATQVPRSADVQLVWKF
jgi:iron complex outermembrane receptor protein